MRPINSAPSIRSINGIGTAVYGRGNYDASTGTYVKYYCLTVLYVPILWMAAYRVAKADQKGWYFLGKERLGFLAWGWNALVLACCCLAMAFVVLNTYQSSGDYRAKKDLGEAGRLVDAGSYLEAAPIYSRLIQHHPAHEAESRQQLVEISRKIIAQGSPEETASILALEAEPHLIDLFPEFRQTALTAVERFEESEPKVSLRILRLAQSHDRTKADELIPTEIALLERLVSHTPEDMALRGELALLYESGGNLEKCAELLLPFKDQLGATEGARILGSLLLAQGLHSEAYPLLLEYVTAHIEAMERAEQAYKLAIDRIYAQGIEGLNAGNAPDAFYSDYEGADEARRAILVEEYMSKYLERDQDLARIRKDYRDAARIVPVALELGIAQLSRAQEISDPGQRQAELQAAESTFLSIQGAAGETDEYRMFLGQVYYWLGRFDEGKTLFDDLLSSNRRDPQILLSVAETLRDVGEQDLARNLAEEAYDAAGNQQQRNAAALLRGLLRKNADDGVTWLEKADTNQLNIQIQLSYARGSVATRNGDFTKAAYHMREAAKGYESLPVTSSSLNNGGLAYLSLFSLTGDPADQRKGATMLEEAVALEPGDSILQSNAADSLINTAVINVVGDKLRIGDLGHVNLDMLAHLYDNETERTAIVDQLRNSTELQKALDHLGKAILLAPKIPQHYQTAFDIYSYFGDAAALNKLEQQLRKANLDRSEHLQSQAAYWAREIAPEDTKIYLNIIQTLEKDLAKQVIRSHPASHAYTLSLLVNTRLRGIEYGIAADAGTLLEMAESAVSLHESTTTRRSLIAALLHSTHLQLASSNDKYSQIADQLRRGLSYKDMFTSLLEFHPDLRPLLESQPTFQKAAELIRQNLERFPSHPAIDDWAFIHHWDPAAAAPFTSAARIVDVAPAKRRISALLSPMATGNILENYWDAQLRNDPQKATQILAEASAQGIPVPTQHPLIP